MVKNPPAGDLRDVRVITGSGRFPGGGHGIMFQYFWLGNPMDRGDLWATVYRITKSRTQLKSQRSWTQTHARVCDSVSVRGEHLN